MPAIGIVAIFIRPMSAFCFSRKIVGYGGIHRIGIVDEVGEGVCEGCKAERLRLNQYHTSNYLPGYRSYVKYGRCTCRRGL
jgi:hypothetical protein